MVANGKPSSAGGELQWPAYNPHSSLGIQIDNATSPGHINYTVCKLWDVINAAQLKNATEANAMTV